MMRSLHVFKSTFHRSRSGAVRLLPFVLLLSSVCRIPIRIRIDVVHGRRLGTPTTTTGTPTSTTTRTNTVHRSRSLTALSFLDTLWLWSTTSEDSNESDLDRVNEYESDNTNTNDENNNKESLSTTTDQIIVRFDQDDASGDVVSLTRDEIEQRAQQIADHWGGTVVQIYEHVFYGATIGNIPSTIMTSLHTADSGSTGSSTRAFVSSQDNVPHFTYELDTRMIGGKSISTIYDEAIQSNIHVQSDAPKPLDRINQRSLPLDQTYKYKYDGTGVTVFVVDTGIRTTHVDLQQTSIICRYSAFPVASDNGRVDGACDDDNGHGTHVAGTIASQTYGVAKGVTLVTVKVLDGSGNGSYTTLLGGIEYMIQYRRLYPEIPMVANLSLGASYSTAINDAVASAIQNNIVVVVAAGNDNTDACTKSPASSLQAITVGASRPLSSSSSSTTTLQSLFSRLVPFRRQERRTNYSNYGSCVDVFAWGSNVFSLGIATPTSIVSKSGTSMATPHVTGTVALYLHRQPDLTPAEIQTSLITDATTSQLQSLYQKKSPNRTLNTQNII